MKETTNVIAKPYLAQVLSRPVVWVLDLDNPSFHCIVENGANIQ